MLYINKQSQLSRIATLSVNMDNLAGIDRIENSGRLVEMTKTSIKTPTPTQSAVLHMNNRLSNLLDKEHRKCERLKAKVVSHKKYIKHIMTDNETLSKCAYARGLELDEMYKQNKRLLKKIEQMKARRNKS